MEGLSPEDRSSKARGYKSTLSNPNVSDEAKKNAQEQLDALGGEDAFYGKKEDEGKNPGNVAGGYKAAINNPDDSNRTVTEEGKEAAQEKLDQMGDK